MGASKDGLSHETLDVWQKRATLPKLVADPRDLEQSGEFPSATESAGPASCSTPRWPAEREHKKCGALAERERVRLIGDLSKLLHDPCVPESAKAAGLELIGWLARRQPGEDAHGYGVNEAATQARGRRRVR